MILIQIIITDKQTENKPIIEKKKSNNIKHLFKQI